MRKDESVPPEQDGDGPAYLRAYRSLDRLVGREEFAAICSAQGLATPTKRMYEHVRALYRHREPNYRVMNAFDQERKARRQFTWTVEDVERLVAEHRPETERVEFKVEIGGDGTTKKPWAAMSNAGGGDVLYGIAEENSLALEIRPVVFAGIDERFQQLNRGIDPPVTMTVSRLLIFEQDSGVVCVRIAPAVRGVVHLVDHRAPVRSGTTTRYMTSEEIRRWIREEQRPVDRIEQLSLGFDRSRLPATDSTRA